MLSTLGLLNLLTRASCHFYLCSAPDFNSVLTAMRKAAKPPAPATKAVPPAVQTTTKAVPPAGATRLVPPPAAVQATKLVPPENPANLAPPKVV